MKDVSEIKPNFGPVYAAALYPALCRIFQRHGYALAVHGYPRHGDLDLIAVPWVAEAEPDHAKVLAALNADGYAVNVLAGPEDRPHGRKAYAVSVGFGECACDISFMPLISVDSIGCGIVQS